MSWTSDSLLFKAGRVLFGGEKPNWVKVSNRSSTEKYPHTRGMKYFDKANTNIKSKLDKYRSPSQTKISNRSSFQKYPHTRDYNIVVFAMKQTNTNTESKSDKYEYRKKQKCE